MYVCMDHAPSNLWMKALSFLSGIRWEVASVYPILRQISRKLIILALQNIKIRFNKCFLNDLECTNTKAIHNNF